MARPLRDHLPPELSTPRDESNRSPQRRVMYPDERYRALPAATWRWSDALRHRSGLQLNHDLRLEQPGDAEQRGYRLAAVLGLPSLRP